jgi:hypothetical protein
MATWEVGSARMSRREPAGVEMLRVLTAGLLVVLVAWAPYAVLRSGSPLVREQVAVREGTLEVPPSIRQALPVITAPPQQGLAGVPGGRFVLAFGRFERRVTAQARARLVRSKGYIARVIPTGAAYLVVSRPYRNHAEARFWSGIFGTLGLQVTTVTRLEAVVPPVLAFDAPPAYWRRTRALSIRSSA